VVRAGPEETDSNALAGAVALAAAMPPNLTSLSLQSRWSSVSNEGMKALRSGHNF